VRSRQKLLPLLVRMPTEDGFRILTKVLDLASIGRDVTSEQKSVAVDNQFTSRIQWSQGAVCCEVSLGGMLYGSTKLYHPLVAIGIDPLIELTALYPHLFEVGSILR
jgi:hypothetical protein